MVFSGFPPTPPPHRWDVRNDRVTITAAYVPQIQPFFNVPEVGMTIGRLRRAR
jgi:hypothetical protein